MDSLYEIEKFNSLQNLFNTITTNKKVNLTNVKGGLQGFIAFLVYENAKKSGHDVLYIVPTVSDAREKYKVLSRFIENIVLFPPEQNHFYFSDAFSLTEVHERETALLDSLEVKPLFVIASMDSLLKKLPVPEEFKKSSVTLKVNEEYDFDDLVTKLTNFGYRRVDVTDATGEFSVRGEIIDVFPMTTDEPIRLDFFDNEIETISYYNPETQRSKDEIEEVTITPVSENWLDQKLKEEAIEKVNKKYGNDEKYEERLGAIESDSLLANNILFPFVSANVSFLDYLKFGSGKDPIVIWSDPIGCIDDTKKYLLKAENDYKALSQSGEVFVDEMNRFFTVQQLVKIINEYPIVKLHLFNTNVRNETKIDMDSRTIESFAGQPKILGDFLKNRINNGYYIHFFAKDEPGLEKVKSYLRGIGISEIRSDEDEEPGLRVSIGEITEGFELAQDKIVFLNESDFFKDAKKPRKTREDTKKINHFTDLKVGDLVVHDEYGIGRFDGLIQIDYGDNPKDMMKLSYANDDVLYIPIEQMDIIQAYIGTGEDKLPKLNEIGTSKWKKDKARAQKAAEDMADELIALYSKRENSQGFSFSPDTVWQQDFENAFPYEETDDQLNSIVEIKKDMESAKTMDRLLCGDVGFGKTEVAFRAAFKAVMDQKQVALLVPTTVLAQQHYITALERFKDFPINIEILSRFKTPKEQKEVIERVKNGEVDILIGTHRILSKDIKFKDLGLLIVDEEQRFGVKSKESIKKLKENVDVLTLSATPIPRTLHMSLSGIRDMSVLEEPPLGRQPIQTYVMKYTDSIIKDAILRELDRNGQIYYIHNRVQDIDRVKDELQKLVPHARIITAHGQMTPKELENVMYRFLNKEYDILVSTTIVENGLNVADANTMIVENGDHFGLSQLYQLRGRVGRSKRQAYTYITYKKQRLTEIAAKRLEAIRDFTAFGSGFKVAMRDLEIRGAGNLLGKQQSGHLVKIGYELYTRILQQAINKRLTGEEVKEMSEATIKSTAPAYFPVEYVLGDEVRFDIYKKIALLRTWDNYDNLEDELVDRFGPIPKSVSNLMLVAMIKNLATLLDIDSVDQNNNRVKVVFNSEEAEKEFRKNYLNSAAQVKNLSAEGKASHPAWVFNLTAKDTERLSELYEIFDEVYTTQEKNKGE